MKSGHDDCMYMGNMMTHRLACTTILTALSAVMLSGAVAAQSNAPPADDFYKERQIRLIIGTDAGGSYDFSGRMVGRHIAKYIAGNPSIVVQNMPGAASLNAVNHVYNVAPQDGSVIAAPVQTAPQQELFGNPNVKFNSTKFQWLGNPNSSVPVVVVWHTVPIKTIADAFQQTIIMGAAGRTSNDATLPALLNNVLGTKFNVLAGYKGGNEVDLAMERGEVAGRASQTWDGWKVTRPDWVKTGKLTLLLQIGAASNTGLEKVPLASDIAKTEEQKQIIGLFSDTFSLGRPLLTGPGVPANRVAILRDAFNRTMTDKEFLAEAAKVGYEVTPLTGEEVQALINHMMSAPAAIIDKARDAITYKDAKNP